MLRLLKGVALAAMLAGAVQAQDGMAPGSAIEGTIRSQVDAFLTDDFGTAFTFAGPGIQRMFGTPENFGAMVRNGYPMVYRPEDLRFGELREIGGALWQKVFVVDAEGRTHVLDYRMGEYDGGWRIDGVQILEAPEVSA
ncbi:DUF4864 domain-containing protein [Tropicibacter sp. S64]|uniref:DUF4864 domain-containing protein n=1 Tax=Tropicibacter sp. S64 TaxID=3415122 RepID=UPI003C79F41C